MRFFSPEPQSFWNRPLDPNTVIDPISSGAIALLLSQIKTHGAGINTTSWSTPIYEVPADQPTVLVRLNPTRKSAALQSAWSAVPLPADAKPSAGTDSNIVVWQPSMDRIWEFWQMSKMATGWEAGWGGAMEHVSTGPGVYTAQSWPGAASNWGCTASSLPVAGGVVTLDDVARGFVDHVLSVAIREPRRGVFVAPAHRTDGSSSDPMSIPEGAMLRLDPALSLSSLGLPPITMMLAEAAQRYGIVVRDQTSPGIVFYGEDPTPTGTNPFTTLMGGKSPSAAIAAFPWSHLQLLGMGL